MRRFLVVAIVLMSALLLQAQQPKQVYITLDVSGSMRGDKYVLANYTTQMIVTLCDEADDIHMIVYGQEKNLSKEENPLSAIQHPINRLVFGRPSSRGSQFDDIIGFNRVYTPSKNKENWLFIIGDGVWSTNSSSYNNDRELFQQTVEDGSLNVCYLQTGHEMTEHNDFTKFVEYLKVVDIAKSSTDPETIRNGCDHFAKKILGFSETTLDIEKNGSKAIKVVAELPIKEFLLVYQDEVDPERLPKIVNASYNGSQLFLQHKGTPTTKHVKDSNNNKTLSGNVWRVKANGLIPAKAQIEVEFDNDVSNKNVSIYPIVDEIEIGSEIFTREGGELKHLGDNTFSICKDEKTALVCVELNEASKRSIPEYLLKKTHVVFKANNKEYTAKYNNGRFEGIIDLVDEKTQYQAELDCPGYFSRVTPINTIVRGDCEPVAPLIIEKESADFGIMSFQQLKDTSIEGTIKDAETLDTLNPEDFDLTVEIEDDFMYEKPKLSIQGDKVIIEVHPKGDWCECLFPTDLNIKLVSTPKQGAFSATDKRYVKTVHPIHLKIVKDRPWLSRCFWVIISLLVLLVVVVYLRLLMKKKRFKKNAMMTPSYYSFYNDLIEDQGGTKLRKDGFGPWFSRWLLPYDERITLSFDRPDVKGLTIIASESRDVVNILKTSCDWDTMDLAGYDHDTDTDKSKTVKMGDRGTISVSRLNGSKDGELVFSAGSENDGAGFRLFLGLLMTLSIICILVLSILVIKSII